MIDYVTLGLLVLVIAQLGYLMTESSRRTKRSHKSRPLFIDTSVLMDGRIVQIAATGFISERLVIPRSVVAELQLLADASDNDRRARARSGLDNIKQLQALDHVKVEMLADGETDSAGVDGRLLELAKKYEGFVCTLDFNLNKVAAVDNIKVLNINELAQGLRLAFLPGEVLSLELLQKGNDSTQGVGYLSDGTMVVVDQGAKLIGQTVQVECVRNLQTAAGRMIFAKVVSPKQQQKPHHKSNGRKQPSSRKTQQSKQAKSSTPEDSLLQLVDKQR
ncbi:TPA: twitching motility protein PilT [Candidatus Saccharibacteria bacterium]|nr:twitching motility protein PilT [Candidatus Saccharibacteria bacterium]HRJ90725.1 twitching motility protein PilT [Candidatus Saccharibacteria bacterium]